MGDKARLPEPPRKLNPGDVAIIRGHADSMALRLACHDTAVHRRLAPEGQAARAVFDAVEQARVEAIGARRMDGVASNLSAMLEDRYHRGGKYEDITDRADAPLEDAVALMVRERLTGLRPPRRRRKNRRAVARFRRGIGPGATSTPCPARLRTSAVSGARCASSSHLSTWRRRFLRPRRGRERGGERLLHRPAAGGGRSRGGGRGRARRERGPRTRPATTWTRAPRRPRTAPSGELPDDARRLILRGFRGLASACLAWQRAARSPTTRLSPSASTR
jgi:hypothetical protein